MLKLSGPQTLATPSFGVLVGHIGFRPLLVLTGNVLCRAECRQSQGCETSYFNGTDKLIEALCLQRAWVTGLCALSDPRVPHPTYQTFSFLVLHPSPMLH
jgi:hypothetical protein